MTAVNLDVATAVRAGSAAELHRDGRLLTKVGALPVVVFWSDDRAWAIEDRCPHMGFPLRQGTVESGLVTCHWHHARFDLESGCTLDLWADDATAFDVTVDGDDVWVAARTGEGAVEHLRTRLREGLEDGLSLVTAKAVVGLLEAGVPPADIVRVGMDFGTRYRAGGWGAGLTVLTAMANVLPVLRPADRALALVHGLVFVSRDTRGHQPRFPVGAIDADIPAERLHAWYRRFIETRSSDAAERTLATAIASADLGAVQHLMDAGVTDHVFIDGGHTIDFTNKAFEALDHLGPGAAADILPTLVPGTARASRSEEESAWRHPHDLVALIQATVLEPGDGSAFDDDDVATLGWRLLADEPGEVAAALVEAARAGADGEQLARAVTYAAALRIVRFHVQNDHGDWDVVHHSFTTANAVHQAMVRHPTDELLRAVVQGAMKVYLDRFLNVPAARPPAEGAATLADLEACWEVQGRVDDAGRAAWGYLAAGGSRDELMAALGAGLLREDAGFHWYQVYEAGVRQAQCWPEGSEESALVLVAVARFLAAHSPTRRELARVVEIAARLRRGENVFEE
jgi:nitrite reductase/ring-hydroxylating ferredoxin subunit